MDRPLTPAEAKRYRLGVTIIIVVTVLGLFPVVFVPDRFEYLIVWGGVFTMEMATFANIWARRAGKITRKQGHIINIVVAYLVIGGAALIAAIWRKPS
jgi:hypothetical protein